MSITYEELLETLNSNKNIVVLTITHKPGCFNRNIEFIALGVIYKIKWYVNICYLYGNNIQVLFHNCDINGYWPNHYKTNINFYHNGIKICILPIQEN